MLRIEFVLIWIDSIINVRAFEDHLSVIYISLKRQKVTCKLYTYILYVTHTQTLQPATNTYIGLHIHGFYASMPDFTVKTMKLAARKQQQI